jgi:hypothetical protein
MMGFLDIFSKPKPIVIYANLASVTDTGHKVDDAPLYKMNFKDVFQMNRDYIPIVQPQLIQSCDPFSIHFANADQEHATHILKINPAFSKIKMRHMLLLKSMKSYTHPITMKQYQPQMTIFDQAREFSDLKTGSDYHYLQLFKPPCLL